jgi:hypothetical protein
VASKNSKVFHKADCANAATIAEKNLIHFQTREEAIASCSPERLARLHSACAAHNLLTITLGFQKDDSLHVYRMHL